MFQSLKGILVDINCGSIGQPSFDKKFQSLKGILVDINFLGFRFDKRQLEFQSLKGILVDINASISTVWGSGFSRRVSIPERDFSGYQPTSLSDLSGVMMCFNP